jgi:hypothetical protein
MRGGFEQQAGTARDPDPTRVAGRSTGSLRVTRHTPASYSSHCETGILADSQVDLRRAWANVPYLGRCYKPPAATGVRTVSGQPFFHVFFSLFAVRFCDFA